MSKLEHARGREESELTDADVKARAVRGVAGMLTRQVVVRIIGFAGMLALARLLTPESFGVFAIAQFVIVFFEQLGGLGLSAALLRKKQAPTEIELRTVFTIQQSAITLAAATIIVVAPAIAEHYQWDESRAALIQVLAASLVLVSWKTMPSLLLQRSMRHDLIAIADVAEHLVFQVTAVTLAFYGFDVWALVIAALARGVTGVVVLTIYASWRPAFGFDAATAREVVRFSAPIQLAGLAGLANSAAAPVVVGSFLGASAVGYANLARTLLDALVYQPLVMMGGVQFRVFSHLQDSKPRLAAAAERSMYLGSVLAFGVASMLIVLAQPLVDFVLTEKWAPIVPLLYILGPAYFVYAVSQPQMQILKALGDSISTLTAVLIMAVVQLSVLAVSIEYLGLTSYAVSAALGILAAGAYVQRRIAARLSLKVLHNVTAPFAAALLGVGAAYCGQSMADNVLGAFAGLSMGLLTYVLALAAFSGQRLRCELTSIVAAFRSKPAPSTLDVTSASSTRKA